MSPTLSLALPTLRARKNRAPMPTATKMPTHASRTVLFMCLDSLEHKCGKDEIESEYGKRRSYHRARGRARHAFRGGRGVVALEQRDRGHRDAEYHALDDPVHYIVLKI